MDYFIVASKIKNVRITSLFNLTQFHEVRNGNIMSLPYANSFHATKPIDSSFPSLLTDQVFMVTKIQWDLLTLFGLKEHRTTFLIDTMDYSQEFYYLPQIETVGCYVDDSNGKLVMDKSRMYPDVFRVANTKNNIVVMSLGLVEAILRRDPFAVKLKKVDMK